MGTPQYHTVRPFSADPKGLPRLIMPDAKLNGVIEGRTFQYQPSDNPKWWVNGGNLIDYAEDEMLYTINKHGFRGNKITRLDTKTKLMTAGCSFTYGIGVRDNEVWGEVLAEELDMYHINIGVGGIGCDVVSLLIKQFFEEGIIPDTLAILWPNYNRKLLVLDKIKSMTESLDNFLVDPNYKIYPTVYQFSPGVNPVKEERDKRHEGLDQAIKGLLLQNPLQALLDFWIYRELVLSLCQTHNVKLVEGFMDIETLNYVKQNCHKNIPRNAFFSANDISNWGPGHGENQESDPYDWARDNMHPGSKAHKNIARKFALKYKESYIPGYIT